ncbi:hypothetical protein EHO61_04735 [Leptospira fluminis]|uniref:Uncharacterized protein n=1 Tax=Leptospira fluminis TaxID=2484979 RepID=A0A4R9GSG5_9LEPT|nr:hypothetical protein EHO61_04735 [Leptospira fluminis]
MHKKIWKRIPLKRLLNSLLRILITQLFLSGCVYPVRYAETLESDRGFLYLSSERFTKEKIESIESPWEAKSLRGKAISTEDHNNLGILFAKRSLLDEAEQEFLEARKSSASDPIPILNLLRLYYLVDAISEAKALLSNYLKQTNPTERNKIEKILLDNLREEELVIFWDSSSSIPGQEVHSWNGLADYFYRKQDWSKSYFYLEKILVVSPYHKNARGLMLKMADTLEKWDEAIVFGQSLIGTAERVPDLEYYLAHAYSEKKRYDEALEWIRKVPESDRGNLRFLNLWRTCLLSRNPRADLTPLVPYFRRLKAQGLEISEEDFLPTTVPEGKEAAERNILGR